MTVEELNSLVDVVMIYIGVVAVIQVVMYVLNGIALQKVLTVMGYRHPWMAWIPLVSSVAMTDVVNVGTDSNSSASKFKYWWYKLWVIPYLISLIIARVANSGVSVIFNICALAIYLQVCIVSIGFILKEIDPRKESHGGMAFLCSMITLVRIIRFLAVDKNLRVNVNMGDWNGQQVYNNQGYNPYGNQYNPYQQGNMQWYQQPNQMNNGYNGVQQGYQQPNPMGYQGQQMNQQYQGNGQQMNQQYQGNGQQNY